MLDHDDLWWMEEPSVEDPSELLTTMPELRHYLAPHDDGELGLRSVLERPDALSRAWWRDANTRRRTHRRKRRGVAILHAA